MLFSPSPHAGNRERKRLCPMSASVKLFEMLTAAVILQAGVRLDPPGTLQHEGGCFNCPLLCNSERLSLQYSRSISGTCLFCVTGGQSHQVMLVENKLLVSLPEPLLEVEACRRWSEGYE